MNMSRKSNVPFFFGRPFLSTIEVSIDMGKYAMTMKIEDQVIVLKEPKENKKCFLKKYLVKKT